MDIGTKIFFGFYNLFFGGLCIYVFIVLIKDRKKCEEKPSYDFYFGRKSIRKEFEEKGDIRISEIVSWIIYMLGTLCSAAVFASESSIRRIWNGTGEMVNDMPGLMFSGIAIISIIGAFVGFRKNTWLGYDVDAIVKEYNIKRSIKIMCLMIIQGYSSLFISILLANITNYYPLYFGAKFLILVAFFVYLLLFIKCIWNIIDILFGEKVASRLIHKLYEELWYSPIRKIKCKNETIQIFEKLLQEYIEVSRKFNFLTEMKVLEFNTNVKDEIKGSRYDELKNISKFFLIVAFFSTYLVGGLGIWIQLPKETNSIWKVLVLVCVVVTLVLIISFCCASKGVTVAAIAIFFGRCGYQFTMQKKICKKSFPVKRYVREVAFIGKNKYYRFVRTTKSIIALFLMICTEKNKEEIKQVIDLYKAEKVNNENVKILLYIMDNLLTAEKIFKENEKIDFNHSFESDKKYMEIAQEFLVDVTGSFTNNGTVKKIELKPKQKKNK